MCPAYVPSWTLVCSCPRRHRSGRARVLFEQLADDERAVVNHLVTAA